MDIFHRHSHDLVVLEALGQLATPDAVVGQVREPDDAFGHLRHEAVEVIREFGVEEDHLVGEALPFEHAHHELSRMGNPRGGVLQCLLGLSCQDLRYHLFVRYTDAEEDVLVGEQPMTRDIHHQGTDSRDADVRLGVRQGVVDQVGVRVEQLQGALPMVHLAHACERLVVDVEVDVPHDAPIGTAAVDRQVP